MVDARIALASCTGKLQACQARIAQLEQRLAGERALARHLERELRLLQPRGQRQPEEQD